MTGKVVSQYTTVEMMQNGTMKSLVTGEVGENVSGYTSIQVATTVTFTVALFQVCLSYLLYTLEIKCTKSQKLNFTWAQLENIFYNLQLLNIPYFYYIIC